jgi:hypothetical protein
MTPQAGLRDRDGKGAARCVFDLAGTNRRNLHRQPTQSTGDEMFTRSRRTRPVAAVAAFALAAVTFVSLAATTTANAQAPTAARPTPGSYTSVSGFSTNNPLTFFVSSNHEQLQDVDANSIGMNCTPEGSFAPNFVANVVALNASGYFSATSSQPIVVDNVVGTLSYVFQGRVGTSAAGGTLTQTLTFTNGSDYTCSSTGSWTAKRDMQPLQQTRALPPAGTYTSTFQLSNVPLTFSVLSDHKRLAHIQDNANGIGLNCAPGGNVAPQIIINTFPLNADGSFNGKSTQHIIVDNADATVNETFQGHFHGIGMTKAARAAGLFTVTVTWKDANNTLFFCTNTTPWRATLSGP